MDEFGDTHTVIADTGLFLEEGMAEGKMPVLLSGRIVPQVTKEFIKTKVSEGKLKTILLVSNELVIPLYDFRDIVKRELLDETGEEVKLGIIVKFGQAVPSAGTDVIPLDTFALPAYVPALRINEVVYNADSDMVMVTVNNLGEGSAFYTNELRISIDGADYFAIADDVPQLIERGEKEGTEYAVDLSEVIEGEITATVITRYGYSKNVLDSWDSLSGPLTTINYTDISELAIQSASYDSEKNRLLITVRNNGGELAHFRNDVDVILDGAPTVVKGTGQSIDGSSLMVDEIPLILTDEDFVANPTITINMDYGAREGFLVKEQSYTLPLEKAEGFPLWLILLILVILFIMIAVFLFIVTRKRKKRTEGREQE
jgi:archaellum component FlaF (FlaF/FlaG flagellin family)